MKVMPTCCWICLSSICISSRRRRSSAPSGSSSRRTRGRLTSARASATRCRWPPESWRGLALLVALEPDHAQRLVDAFRALLAVDLLDHQAVRDVVADRHVREQRVVLEHRVDVALERRHVRDVAAVEQDAAGGRQLEAGDHAQGRGLAAARRPEHREELAVPDLEVDVVHGDDVAETLLDAL